MPSVYIRISDRSARGSQKGVTLLIVLIMVMLIGITSAAAIRGAISNEKMTNNMRMENLAQQYAEAALRYCEDQVKLADGARIATLKEAKLTTVVLGGAPVWNNAASWFGGAKNASLTSVPVEQISSLSSSFSPTIAPQCIVERQTKGGGNITYVVTARGFSLDYTVNAGTGATVTGSVVWLQSELYLE